jgi:perosamine synthetase
MNIFNSLGSNYNLSFVAKNLTTRSTQREFEQLQRYLSKKYDGKVLLTYKGREALRLALRACDMKGAAVGICGFTCFAVYEAIVQEGYSVEYLDIQKDDLNFSAEELSKAIKANPRLKIIFIQNTLGYPCEIQKIKKICQEKNIILLEDLAHSIGARYRDGSEAGTVGDFTMLSFSQDKVIDSVSGGALIIRNKRFYKRLDSFILKKIEEKQEGKDKQYPLNTYMIRSTYTIGLGKLMHAFLKKLNALSNPMLYSNQGEIHSLPLAYADTIYRQFLHLHENLKHREKIANIYKNALNKVVLLDPLCSAIDSSSNLRFPIVVENRNNLIEFLKKYNIHISDIWYDAPIGPKKYLSGTSYRKGMCLNAEVITDKIINLPTHINVSEKDAVFISQKINRWLKLQ